MIIIIAIVSVITIAIIIIIALSFTIYNSQRYHYMNNNFKNNDIAG